MLSATLFSDTPVDIINLKNSPEGNKTNQFPVGPYIKSFVIHLDFLLNNHVLLYQACGQQLRIVSRSGYI